VLCLGENQLTSFPLGVVCDYDLSVHQIFRFSFSDSHKYKNNQIKITSIRLFLDFYFQVSTNVQQLKKYLPSQI
jgi:hypothetical protein